MSNPVSFFFCLPSAVEVEEVAEQPDQEDKKEPRRCSSCKQFLKASDMHLTCIICRQCSKEKPCPLDSDWTDEQWEEVTTKRKEKAAKKPVDLNTLMEVMSRFEQGFASRLTALEERFKVR